MRFFVLAILILGCGGAPTAECPPFQVRVEVPGNHVLDRAALAPIVGPLETVRAGPLAYYDLFEDRLDTAISGLTAAYFDQGYVSATIDQPVVALSEDRGSLHIRIPVTEGRRYRMGATRFVELDEGGHPYDDAALPFGVEAMRLPVPETPRQLPGVREGQWFSRRRVMEAVDSIEALYAEQGYARVDVEPQTEVDQERARIDVEIRVQRGHAYVIDAVEVLDERHGLREMSTGIRVGQPYARSQVDAAQRALEQRFPDREVRVRVEALDDDPTHALLRFVLLER